MNSTWLALTTGKQFLYIVDVSCNFSNITRKLTRSMLVMVDELWWYHEWQYSLYPEPNYKTIWLDRLQKGSGENKSGNSKGFSKVGKGFKFKTTIITSSLPAQNLSNEQQFTTKDKWLYPPRKEKEKLEAGQSWFNGQDAIFQANRQWKGSSAEAKNVANQHVYASINDVSWKWRA